MTQPIEWPEPADPDAAARLIERFGERECGADAMLRAIGGGSPYLSDLLIRERDTTISVVRLGPDAAFTTARAALTALQPNAPRAQIVAGLRAAKRSVALICALADIGGIWSLAEVTGALSWLAETTLAKAIDHLLLAAHAAREITLPNPDEPGAGSGLTVLGMGKLGAGELNYSSDIDLILFYDPAAQIAHDALGATFSRVARNLVAIMETRDANGYVFRTDLRLRPDPAATPPVVSLPAALAYYESMGLNWERAAMIKARPVAGDRALGRDFLQQIRPFVWRRGLDFAAIADIHAMKRRIDQHRKLGESGASIAGLDIKLGQGGIREVEFAAQTLQLVWGGRDPSLRNPTTLGALRGLVRAGRLSRRAAAELTVAYRFLRRVEHRLQMVADRQTHAIPSKPDELRRFAVFMGCRDVDHFTEVLERQMARVRRHYAEVFEAVPEPSSSALTLDLSGRDEPAATVAALRALGFSNVSGMIATLRGWRAGRLRALRSERSRELLHVLLPTLLEALGEQTDPDTAFNRFDQLLSRLPAGVQLLSMFERNPALLGRVASVLGAAPSLAEHLASIPAALEGLLGQAVADSDPNPGPGPDPGRTLARRLEDARTLEDVVAITRAFVRAEEFRLGVSQMEGWIDADAAGLARTALADAGLTALLAATLREHTAKHGRVRGGAIAVVALGKVGSCEMMAGSDLDLMLIYTHPERVTESDGPRRLSASTWFIRAAHAFVAALTAPGRDGPLYEVDMRLRPSGNKGPVAVSLAGFRRYHAQDAWTWERMALTRARVVAGGPAMIRRTERAIAEALAHPQAASKTLSDAAHMRSRLAQELPPTGPWDVKLRPGGGLEVDFIAQTLELVHGVAPGCQSTRAALAHLASTGVIPAAVADRLIRADRLWRTMQGMLRILVGRATNELPPAAAEKLLRVIDPTLDLPGLRATMEMTAAEVRAAFRSLVGEIN